MEFKGNVRECISLALEKVDICALSWWKGQHSSSLITTRFEYDEFRNTPNTISSENMLLWLDKTATELSKQEIPNMDDAQDTLWWEYASKMGNVVWYHQSEQGVGIVANIGFSQQIII